MNTDPVYDADGLVGAIAFESLLKKFPMAGDEDFRGAFHVLSGFTARQLFGFVEALRADYTRAPAFQIRFPRAALEGFPVPGEYLTELSAVGVRNEERGSGKIVVTAEIEDDSEASLSDSDRTDSSDLKDPSLAPVWIHFVSHSVNRQLLTDDRQEAEALLKGLFSTGSYSTAKVGKYITAVLKESVSMPLQTAAGICLPVLDLPLFEHCFTSMSDVRKKMPEQWANGFKAQSKFEGYLHKRGLASELLDPEKLRLRLAALKEPDQVPPMPPDVLQAFQEYIDAPGQRSEATERLLFDFDWNLTRFCFDVSKQRSAKDFSERTRDALLAESVPQDPEDDLVIESLKKISRRSGQAPEDCRDFFERRGGALEQDPQLYGEWEDFVHGKRLECDDLVQGIFECLKRGVLQLKPGVDFYVVIAGRAQKKPNSFMEINRKAAEFFEREYRSLPAVTNGRIKFVETMIFDYSKDVLPRIKDRPKFGGTKKSAKALSLDFRVHLVDRPNAKLTGGFSLTWKFPIESVLAEEIGDFDAISRYALKKKTTLVYCNAEYEGVGRKGVTQPLSLESTEGFADSARRNGRGAFVPAQERIESISGSFREALETARRESWFDEVRNIALLQAFESFEEQYNATILALRDDAMSHANTPAVADRYRELLLCIADAPHQAGRRALLRIILSVGMAQVARSGRREPLAVVCPWHPLRMESIAARQLHVISLLSTLLSADRPSFSDGQRGTLFFSDVEQLMGYPHFPEAVVIWDATQPVPRVAVQSVGGYTFHRPPAERESAETALTDEANTASVAIEREIADYLRLQPHERDHLSILLYDCESRALPLAVVKTINKLNENSGQAITCEILLTHHDEGVLRQIYRDLVANGGGDEEDALGETGDFLARVRVNISATSKLRKQGRSQPVDIAYSRDLISREAKVVWHRVRRETLPALELQQHQWGRRLPILSGDRRVRLQLVCPAQTEAGWAHLYAVAELCDDDAQSAWVSGKCPILIRSLDLDDQCISRIFEETHDLANWVVNQDELLDRRLLESCGIKVIRYVQSATQGRNLVISSKARETLLVNTLAEKLKLLLPVGETTERQKGLVSKILEDANKISGGLILKAARRANNTNELLGMVLTRYLVQAEIGLHASAAWCFLDDFSQWLGKKEGASLADLLILRPSISAAGGFHLDIIVTEAKFVTYDGLGTARSGSQKQLADTLVQLARAISGNLGSIDQDMWLARLSDLLLLQTSIPAGQPQLDLPQFRQAVRQRSCSFCLWGYSHIFVYEPQTVGADVAKVVGVTSPDSSLDQFEAYQEIFAPEHITQLLSHYLDGNVAATNALRLKNGLPSTLSGDCHARTSLAGTTQTIAEHATVEVEAPAAVSNEATATATIESDSPPPEVAPPTTAETSPDNLISFLTNRSATFTTSDEEGEKWLSGLVLSLRQSLIKRGLTARLIDEAASTLTPNAGIVKFQGSKELTVQAVESKASEIFTSDGIQIISVTPESGRISIAVKRPVRQILHTEQVLLNYLKLRDPSADSEEVVVGIAEEDGSVVMLNPLVQPHTLVAGMTGSGKSILIQNLLLTIAASRSPDKARIYLIDPKFGLDYRPLEALPHLQLGSKAIIDDPDAAIEILKNLVIEMNDRYRAFKEAEVPNIAAYRRKTGKVMPTLWVVHDEFTDWMMIETYRKTVPDIVNRLSVKARAAGIFLIFAAQRPDKDAMPMQLRSQLGNRLILKVDNEATSEIALGFKHGGAEKLLGRGHMLAAGEYPHPIYAQVPYIDIETTVPKIVEIIRRQYPTPTAEFE